MNREINEIARRTYRYYYEDGLVEIAIGGMFALLGLSIFGFGWLLDNTSLGWIMGIALPLLIIGSVFGVKQVLLTLKQRITYPRTGSVTYKDQPGSGRWLMVAAVLVVALVNIFLPEKFWTAAVAAGSLMSIIFFYMGRRVGLLRLQAAALIPLGAGIFAGFTDAGELMGNAIVFGSTGIGLFILGIAALSSYLSKNPVQGGE